MEYHLDMEEIAKGLRKSGRIGPKDYGGSFSLAHVAWKKIEANPDRYEAIIKNHLTRLSQPDQFPAVKAQYNEDLSKVFKSVIEEADVVFATPVAHATIATLGLQVGHPCS